MDCGCVSECGVTVLQGNEGPKGKRGSDGHPGPPVSGGGGMTPSLYEVTNNNYFRDFQGSEGRKETEEPRDRG